MRWRIFSYFLGFAGLLVVVLWLFQIVYLDSFYRSIKTKQIEAYALAIEKNIDNEELPTLLSRIAQEGELCLSIYNLTQEEISASWDFLSDCVIHRFGSTESAVYTLQHYYVSALENGGSYTEILQRGAFKDVLYNQEFFTPESFFSWGLPRRDRGLSDSMILSRVVKNRAGDEIMLLLNSNISPVGATVDTLRVQLFFITIILIVLALLISFLISRRLSAPIMRINKKAKGLATGDLTPNFDGKGYKETNELAATLNYAADELSRTEKLQRELIANISHDLRTPLTMIGGYAEVMRDLPEENNAENAQVIIDEVRRLSSLVTDVLDLSKLQSGLDELQLARFDLGESVRAIVETYRHLAAPDGYTIEFAGEGPAWVEADESKIIQVVQNFMNNALTYTGVDKTVSVRQTLRDGRARVEITDTGVGIAPERLPQIWQRYYRNEESHVRASHGSGLGLSIVRNILELHKTQYGVHSKMNQGSTFWFELPLVQPPEQPTPPHVSPSFLDAEQENISE